MVGVEAGEAGASRRIRADISTTCRRTEFWRRIVESRRHSIMGGATAEHSSPRLDKAPVVRCGRTPRLEQFRQPVLITQGTVVRSRFDQPYPKRGPACQSAR